MSERHAGWLAVRPISGGQVAVCRLCGKGFTRTFLAKDTNYAEALRLATAYASRHEKSDAHAAALAAFHSDDAPTPTARAGSPAEIFGSEPRTEIEMRREAARAAAAKVRRDTDTR